jgi:glycosyltransferase involved in cell wall biosynthesis
MRLGFDSKRLFLNDRGLGNYARNLLYGLTKYYSDHEYYLFTPSFSPDHVPTAFLDTDNVHVKTPEGLSKYTRSYWRSYKLGGEAKKNKLDIFHGLSQELPRDMRKSGIKSIVTIHDMIFLKHPGFYRPIDRWIYYNKVKFAVKNSDRIVAISNQTKNDLVEEFKISEDRINVIYQSCNEVFYDKRAAKELADVKKKWSLPDQFLLYVGALNDNKNVNIILEALNILKGKVELPLVVVGHGTDYKKKMLSYARQHDLEQHLKFASDIANPTPLEISAFYQLAKVFIFPSFYEGFGIPILEARFSGVPVIASNSTCLEEAGGVETKYFDPNNAEELADILLKLEDLKTTYPANFKQEVLTKKVVDLYNKN